MPPYRVSKKDIEQWKRQYVQASEEIDADPVCYQESKVVKPDDRASKSENDWEVFELVDVVATGPDGKHANLLFAARDGKTFLVTGKVHVDEEYLKSRLVTYRRKAYKNLNGSRIRLDNPDNVSMGVDPITLWISSNGGWYEVKPAHEYRPTYEKMVHVVGVFFLAVDDFEKRVARGEECHASDVPYDLERIFKQYMLMDGSGVTRAELLNACRESHEYLLEQFRKKMRNEYWVGRSGVTKWTDCNIYRWVVGGCPTIPPGKMECDPELVNMIPRPVNPNAESSTTWRLHSTSKSPSPKTSCTPQPTLSPQPTQSANNKPPSKSVFHGQYISSEFPNGILDSHTNIDIISAIACHSKASRRHMETNITNLGWDFYWDFSVDGSKAARQVVHYYAKAVAVRLAELNGTWKKTTLYKELLEVEVDTSEFNAKDMKKFTALTKNGQTARHRKKTNTNRGPVKAKTSTQASRNASPSLGQPSTSKVPLPIPIQNLTVSDDATDSQPSKKRKVTPPPAPELPPEKRHRDPAIISRSRPSSPEPVEDEKVTYDSHGKPILKRIKRAKYFMF